MANLKDTIILGDLSVTGAVTTNNINIQDLYVGSISPISGTNISVGGSLTPAGGGRNIGTSGNRWNFGYFSALSVNGSIAGTGSISNSGLMRKYTGVTIKNSTAITARAAANGVKCYVTGLNGASGVFFGASKYYSGMFCVAIDDRDATYGDGTQATCYFYGTSYYGRSANAQVGNATLYGLPV
jgi:hypothetical protein